MTKIKSKPNNQPSEDLLDLINYVNLIPIYFELPNVELLHRNRFEELTGISIEKADIEESPEMSFYDSKARDFALEQFGLRTAQFPDFFKKLNEISIRLRIRRLLSVSPFYQCSEFVNIRYDVRKLIFFSRVNKWDNKQAVGLYLYAWHFKSHFTPSIDVKNGKVNFSPSLFLKATDGIEVERLRICQYCERVFWAYYKNSLGCSKNCANNLRQKRKRDKDKEILQRRSRHRNQLSE